MAEAHRARTFAAFAAVPFFDAGLGYFIVPTVRYLGGDGPMQTPAEAGVAFALLSGVLGALVTLCGAVPLLFWLDKRGPISVRQAALGGFALGNIPLLLILAGTLVFTVAHVAAGTIGDHVSPPAEVLAGFTRVFLIGSVMGTASGVLFWLLGIRGTRRAA